MTTCPQNTIDSNITGLAVAEEICPGQLPTIELDGYLPIWYEQEPNTYPSTFGGTLKTTARAPIKANRQRSKGTPVDLDASGGWNTDYTQNNLTRALQGFFFADAREKVTTSPLNAIVAAALTGVATHVFAGTGLPRFRAGDIVVAKGTVLNDDTPFFVTASTPTAITTSAGPIDETFDDDAALAVVGKSFTNGLIAVVVSGEVGTLHSGTAPVAATGIFTISGGQPADGDTVTIDGRVYTWRTVPSVADDVLIGGSITISGQNLTQSINGTTTLSTPNKDVSAANGAAGIVNVTARLKGVSENGVTTTEVGANTAWTNATLTAGTGISLLSLGFVPGEWGFLGGDTAGTHFVNNIGYFRVGSCTDTDLVMDKTTWDVEAEAATGISLQIYNGTLIQNENDPALIKARSYQLQRTLGKDADGTQSQYITGAVCSDLQINLPLAAPITVDLSYIAQTTEYRTGAQGLKAGLISPAANEDAINTSNDVYEIAMTVIDGTDSNPTRLFGYLSKADLKINNNVSATKGIGKLGGIGVNVGIFEVSGTATAYFQNVAANIAITNSADVSLHFITAKHNAGFVYDVSLLTLGGGNITIASNKPIEVPLTVDAAEGSHGATLTTTIFGYLPTLAMPIAA
jgi:hypothetical protein